MNESLLARANAVDWWHSGIDLGNGIVTQGRSHPAVNLLPYLGLPDDLTGKTVIDICTWDGFMAFECERRGARVTAVDSFAWDKCNAALTKHGTGADGFKLARQARQSRVYGANCDVLDLSVDGFGTYDIVLFLGVLYHMRHPLLALEKVAPHVADGGVLILETHADMIDSDKPVMRFYPGDEINGDSTNWWGPNAACVKAMLHDVGFAHVEQLPSMAGRVVMRASRGAK